MIRFFLTVLGLCAHLAGWTSNAYTSQNISHAQGLSNSAVLSILQDNEGLMWFGTYDGLNCYDGRTIRVYRTDFTQAKPLDNNIISRIQIADGDDLWVQTFSGINLFSTDSLSVIENYSFPNEETLIHSNRKGNTWVIGRNNIYYYNTAYRRFVKAGGMKWNVADLKYGAFVDESGTLSVLPSGDTKMYHFSLPSFGGDSLQQRAQVTSSTLHTRPVVKTFIQGGVICFIDNADDLYLYDSSRRAKVYIRNIRRLTERYGAFMNIFPFNDNIMITLNTGGILLLKSSQQYAEQLMRADLRIFSAYWDNRQGILWLGSDGSGVVKLVQRDALVTNIILERLSPLLSGQVRGIMTDPQGTLWVGTKGDGLLRIPGYRGRQEKAPLSVYSPEAKQSLSDYRRGAGFHTVFSMKKQRRSDDFWVGMSDSLLYYYSYARDRICAVEGSLGKTCEIHGVYEENDSVIWLATIGAGIVKVTLGGEAGRPKIREVKRLRCFADQMELLEYSSLLPRGDSILWLGSRGQGLVRVSVKTGEYQVYSLRDMLGKTVDDILCLCAYDSTRFFVGTTAGLVSLKVTGRRLEPEYIGREQGFFNDMIHGIVKDDAGILWLGTNRGVIKYDPVSKGSYTYYYSKGIEIGEFSDDSYYRCPYTGDIFLGGINGLLYKNNVRSSSPEYYPPLVLRGLFVGREAVPLHEYYLPDKREIRLSEDQNTFSLEFAALDYQNPDIEYAYMLEGRDDKWSLFTKENEAIFHNVPPGRYVLRVRYKKDVLDAVYKEHSVVVRIIPDWHHASITYILLSIAVTLCGVWGLWVLYRRGFFARLLLAWKISKNGVEAVSAPATYAAALGCWAEDFPYCKETEQVDFVKRVLEVLEENLSREDLGSAFLAEKMYISPRQFGRKFKDLSGGTPIDFIKKYRMVRAAYLLRETEMPIQEVIESVGISSRPYFYKEFSQKYGVTPKIYREQYKGR